MILKNTNIQTINHYLFTHFASLHYGVDLQINCSIMQHNYFQVSSFTQLRKKINSAEN